MLRIVLFLCLTLASLTPYVVGAEPVVLTGDFGASRVIVPAPKEQDLHHLSWPKVVRTSDGTLVTAYIAGEFHGSHGGGCPAVSFSSDNGKTFSAPNVLKRYQKGDQYTSAGNVALGIANDGAVVLLAMAYNGSTASTIDGWRSVDSGRTWQPTDVSSLDHGQTGSVFGHVINVPSKGLAVFGHYRPPATTETGGLWMAWSADHGKSWGEPQNVASSDQRLYEPAFTFTEGRFVGLVRGEKNSGSYVQMTRDSFGQAWDTMHQGLVSDHVGNTDLPSPHIAVDPARDNHLYALVSERYKEPSAGVIGRIVLYEANTDELNWTKVGDVVRFPKQLGQRNDITYAWMTPLENGRWFAVFYCGERRGPSDIYGLEFSPTDRIE